jgi:protein-S-isoprenylcysteine O-methyltransferase Ste14
MKYKIGNLLFKLRSFTPIPLLLAVGFFKPQKSGELGELILILSLGLLIFGELIRILVVGYSAEGTSGREVYLRADDINTSGIYSLMRNPLYLGNLIIYNGLLLIIFNPILFLIMNLFFCIQYYFIICSEENFLEKKYGEHYLKYRNSTNKVIPNFKKFKPAVVEFKAKKVLFKEVDSIFNMIIMWIGFLLYRIYYLKGSIKEPIWFYISGGIVIITYIIIRIKKKHLRDQVFPCP